MLTERMDASSLRRACRLLRRCAAAGGVGGYAQGGDELRLGTHLVRGPGGSQRRARLPADQGARHLQPHGRPEGKFTTYLKRKRGTTPSFLISHTIL